MASEPYDEGYTVIANACSVGIAWNYKELTDLTVQLTPYVYRNDYSWDGTDDEGYFHEVLSPDADGLSHTWYNIGAWGSEESSGIRLIDTFSPRIYDRKAIANKVGLTINWHNWQSHGESSGSGWHEFSKVIPAAASPKAPVADSEKNFVERVGSSNSFRLSWAKPEESETDVPSTFKNVIVRRRVNNDSWTDYATIAGDATTYTDANTVAGNTYSYVVKYSNGVKQSSNYPSQSSAATLYTSLLIPLINKVTFASDGKTATIKWTNDNAQANFNSQKILYSTDGGATYSAATGADGTELTKAKREYAVKTDNANALYLFKIVIDSSDRDIDDVESSAFIAYTQPAAVTGISHTRVSDTTNTVTWTYSANENNLEYFAIYRSANGSAFSQLAIAEPSARSYTDDSCQMDNSYSYKVYGVNDADSSPDKTTVASEITRNTPSAPVITSGYRLNTSSETGKVVLVFENTSQVANGMYIYVRQETSTTRALLAQEWGKTTRAEVDVSAYSGVLYFSASNTTISGSDTLESASSDEYKVAVAQLPNFPVVIEPADGGIASYTEAITALEAGLPSEWGDEYGGALVFKWLYESTDGSPQASAEVKARYKENGEYKYLTAEATSRTVAKAICTSMSKGTLDASAFVSKIANGTVVEWYVAIESASSNERVYSGTGSGDYNASFTYYDRPRPVVSITNLNTEGVLQTFPIQIAVTANDLARFDLAISESSDGSSPVFANTYEGSSASISLDEFVPEHGTTYYVFVTAYNKLGMSSFYKAMTAFTTASESTLDVQVSVKNNANDGTATVTILASALDTSKISKLALVRVSDHKTTLLESDSTSAVVVDKYAPINLEYTYRVLAFSIDGGFDVSEIKNTIRSPYWFFMWGNKVAKGKWDCSDPWAVSRPDKTQKHYAGRKDPVSYDTSSLSMTHSSHFWVKTREEAMNFYQLVLDGGRCVYKSGEGFVIKADVDVNVAPTHQRNNWYGEIECDITRISGSDSL